MQYSQATRRRLLGPTLHVVTSSMHARQQLAQSLSFQDVFIEDAPWAVLASAGTSTWLLGCHISLAVGASHDADIPARLAFKEIHPNQQPDKTNTHKTSHHQHYNGCLLHSAALLQRECKDVRSTDVRRSPDLLVWFPTGNFDDHTGSNQDERHWQPLHKPCSMAAVPRSLNTQYRQCRVHVSIN